MKYILTIMFVLLISSPAYAYIDPGTGSFLLQGLIAAFLTTSLTIKTYWNKLKTLFKKKKKPEQE